MRGSNNGTRTPYRPATGCSQKRGPCARNRHGGWQTASGYGAHEPPLCWVTKSQRDGLRNFARCRCNLGADGAFTGAFRKFTTFLPLSLAFAPMTGGPLSRLGCLSHQFGYADALAEQVPGHGNCSTRCGLNLSLPDRLPNSVLRQEIHCARQPRRKHSSLSSNIDISPLWLTRIH